MEQVFSLESPVFGRCNFGRNCDYAHVDGNRLPRRSVDEVCQTIQPGLEQWIAGHRDGRNQRGSGNYNGH